MRSYNIEEINYFLRENKRKLVLDNESRYRGQLFELAEDMVSKGGKVVLIGGPSCAGKTTTCRLLHEILEKKGFKVVDVSMDDFFKNRVDTPLLPNGNKDYDSIRAINLDQMERCFTKLFKEGKAGFPQYDFITGENTDDVFNLEYDENTVIIFEGLHVLNPELIQKLGTTDVYKVYACALSTFNLMEDVLDTVELRLIRRMIRDVSRRGHSPMKTFNTWNDVCEAEDKYITPFSENVDFRVDTTHSFELALYKKEMLCLIREYPDVIEKIGFVVPMFEKTLTLPKEKLPKTSLMWEFLDMPEKFKKEPKPRKVAKKTTKKATTK